MQSRVGRRTLQLTLCAFLMSFAASVALSEKPTTTISGVVGRDSTYRDKVVGVYTRDADNTEYLVVRDTVKGKELRGLVGATVKATGYVRKSKVNPNYEWVIDVLEYEVIKPPKGQTPKPAADKPTDAS